MLAIDCDPQGGLTSFLSDGNIPDVPGTYDFIMMEPPQILQVNRDGIILDFMAASYKLDKIYATIDHFAIKRALKELENKWDYILFDCPPTVQGITRACAFISDEIYIPCDISRSSLNPTLYTIESIEEIEKQCKVLIVGKDESEKGGYNASLCKEYKEKIGNNLLGFIPRNTTIAKIIAGAVRLTENKKKDVFQNQTILKITGGQI